MLSPPRFYQPRGPRVVSCCKASVLASRPGALVATTSHQLPYPGNVLAGKSWLLPSCLARRLGSQPATRSSVDWIYTLPNWLFFIVCCGVTLLVSLVGLVLLRPWVRAHAGPTAEHNDLVSYFLGVSGVIYGILLGLVAAGVWSNFQTLSGQVDNEATITAALYQDMATYPPADRQRYQRELRAYVRAIIHQDWPAHHQGVVPQQSSIILRSFKNHLLDFVPTTPRLSIVHAQTINQLNELLLAHRLRLRGNQTNLPALLWWVLILGALINVAISWFFVSDDLTHQVALTCLIALLLGSLLFLTAAIDNPFRGDFSVDASAFDSVLYEMVTY